jgi:hypothetical protein
MPTTKQQRRRALELLEASIDGCTEAIMLAYGFKTELLIELINAGFATTSIERMVAGAPHQSDATDPGCVKTHTSAKCRKHNSPARHRTSRVQYDLTLRDAIDQRYFYVRRERWSFRTAKTHLGHGRPVLLYCTTTDLMW